MKKEKNREYTENRNNQKKKISKYEVFRRIMLVVCICLVVALAVQLVISIVDSLKAKQLASDILSEVTGITRPMESIETEAKPITIWTEPEKTGIVSPTETAPKEESSSADGGETEETSPETPFETEIETPPETSAPETEETEPPVSEYFSQWLANIQEMKKKYPDFVGYIRIENLDILYPIVQTDNNSFYLDHLIDGSKNKSGEIFMDYRNNSSNLTDNQNIVLYGHNLGDGTKFHNLTDLRKKENYYNSPIEIITEEGIYTFTIFSFYKTDNNQDFTPITFGYYSIFGMFCITEQEKSMHESNFKFTGKELIITLSTCVNDFGGRWCTHAVLTNISK